MPDMMTYRLIQFLRREVYNRKLPTKIIRQYFNMLAENEEQSLHIRLLKELIRKFVDMERRLNELLKNTLPETVVDTIKYEGAYVPRLFNCTILFTDFVDFTRMTEKIPLNQLIVALDRIFADFDGLMETYGGTKIKTIGDAYMAVFGAPDPVEDHAVRAIHTALAMQDRLLRQTYGLKMNLQMRIGIHSGEVMAGVVGRERMQFDVFGDHVNIASRFETESNPGMINVSETTYRLAAGHFQFQPRGMIALKHKAPMQAFFVRDGKHSKGEKIWD